MDNRLDLLDYIEKCGGLSEAAMQLKIPAIRLGDAALGLAPLPPKLARLGLDATASAVEGARAGRQILASYMKMSGFVTTEEAADSLRVTPGYLLQQTGMAHPTGAVVNEMRRQVEDAARRAAVPEERRIAAQKQLAEALARRAAERKAEAPESIEQHNARVLAERKNSRGK